MASYEYRTKLLKNRVGVGLMGFYKKVDSPTLNTEEASFAPRINYYLIDKKYGNIYAGVGVAYGYKQDELGSRTNQPDFRGQVGLNLKIIKGLNAYLEWSNYTFIDNGFNPMMGVSFRF